MSDDQVDVDAGALFGVDELHVTDPATLGRVEAGCYAALRAGSTAFVVGALDAGLAAAALAAARRLDEAERVGIRYGDLKAGYLFAQLLPQYLAVMQALRLPAEVEPADVPQTPAAPVAGDAAPSWVHDLAGRAE